MAPAAKRRRTSTRPTPAPEQEQEQEQEQGKHTLFTKWSQDRGVQINSVQPSIIPGRGVGLITTSPIKKDEQIMFVPEKAMFKPQPTNTTTSSSKPKPSPQAHLAMSVMSGCLRPDSLHHTWRATWPTPQDFHASMPLFWPAHLVSHLPPSVRQPLDRMREDYEHDWNFVRNLHPDWSEEEFKYYWAIVNSRSFHFKPSSFARARPGFMVLCPFIDYMNHGPGGTGVKVGQTPRGYEVVADRDYAANEEILATYGSHPNDKLLVHYGFINSSPSSSDPITSPSDDDIRLDHILLQKLSPTTKSQLQDVGFLGPYALLPPSSHRSQAEICFKTQVAVRAELVTANEWEYFMLNGEDMTLDQSGKVKEWLRPGLERYRGQAREKLVELGKMEVEEESAEAGAVFWLKLRWKQIEEAVDAFLKAG